MNAKLKLTARRWIILCLLLWLAPSCLLAQKTEADIGARLLKKPLFLRGQWSNDKLTFDDVGHLMKVTSGPTSFTLSGVEIASVKLTSIGLVLNGQRMGLEFKKDVPKRVGLLLTEPFGQTSREDVTIKIQTPTDGDFTTALDAIFTDSIATLDLPLPWCWQQYAHEHLFPAGTATKTGGVPHPVGYGQGTSNPRVKKQVEPGFSAAARALNYSGIVLVNMMVGKDGIPTHVRILRATGLGLDELAVAAVSQYVFEPATEFGTPVEVELNVEVNFQVF